MGIYMAVATLLPTFVFDTTHIFPENYFKKQLVRINSKTPDLLFFSSDKLLKNMSDMPQGKSFHKELHVSFQHNLSLYDKL